MPILAVAGHMGRKTMEEPAGLPLVAGERVTGQLYVNTRDVRIRGFQWVGSGLEGKLVLTTYRLFYCFYDEKSIAFAITPRDVASIELVPRRTLSGPKIAVTCTLPGEASARRRTFGVPTHVGVQEPAGLGVMHTVTYENPGNAADFAAALQGWQDAGGARDEAVLRELATQRRNLVQASVLSDGRNAILRLLVALPCALLTFVAPIFGWLAIRDARRLRAAAEREGLPAPPRLAWAERLGIAWMVLGLGTWVLLVLALLHPAR